MRPVDLFDMKILAALQTDSSLTSAELAERVGLSQAPCWRRVQRLKEEGYVAREVAILDKARLGFNLEIFAHVKLTANGRANLSAFTDSIAKRPEVLECYVLLGPIDCLLRIVVADMNEYQRFFFEHLSPLPGVQEVNSMVTLAIVKSTTELPLRGPAQAA